MLELDLCDVFGHLGSVGVTGFGRLALQYVDEVSQGKAAAHDEGVRGDSCQFGDASDVQVGFKGTVLVDTYKKYNS